MDTKTWKSEFTFWINNKPEISTSIFGYMIIKFTKNGVLHNIDFPSIIHVNPDKIVTDIYYYENGLPHRAPEDGVDKPANIRFHDNNKLCSISFYIEGLCHRNPINGIEQHAYIEYYEDGTLKTEIYYKDGKRHRTPINGVDQPAEIYYHKDGTPKEIMYYIDDKLHRNPINGISQPAYIYNGHKWFAEQYYINGELYREPIGKYFLPTEIKYTLGERTKEEHYILDDGSKITSIVPVKNPELWNKSKGMKQSDIF